MTTFIGKTQRTIICGLFVVAVLALLPANGMPNVVLSKGQSVYVAIYSHIYSGNKELPIDLAATLSIRNTNPHHAITINAVDYYDSHGTLVNKYLEESVTLDAMATMRYVVKESDKTGGSGANFIVRWTSSKEVNAPLIESVMIGTKGGQGLSFTSRGQVIRED